MIRDRRHDDNADIPLMIVTCSRSSRMMVAAVDTGIADEMIDTPESVHD